MHAQATYMYVLIIVFIENYSCCTCACTYADIDECANNPCQNGTCFNTNGSFICTCPFGYLFDPINTLCIGESTGSII